MAARDCEAKAATRAGEIILGDLLNRDTPVSHALSEQLEVTVGRDLKAGEIHARCIRRPQNDGMVIEFVPPLEIDPAIIASAHQVEPDAVDVVGQRAAPTSKTRI